MATGQKVAIVTGAASGLGRAMALGLAGSGMHVVAVDRDGPALGKLQAPSGGGSIMPLPADLTQPDVFERIPAAAVKEFGRIDVLVNNAGIGQSSVRADQRRNPIRLWEVPPEQWSRFLAVNATAPIMMARAVVPHLLRAKMGPRRHRDHEPRHDGARGLSSLRIEQGGGRISHGGAGRGSRRAPASPPTCSCPAVSPIRRWSAPTAGDRAKMLQPEIMVPPLLWLVSPAADGVNARRFVAADWDTSLPPAHAAEKAGVPIAWLGIARMPIEPT